MLSCISQKSKNRIIRLLHWSFGRILILHTFALLMLFSERASHETQAPFPIWVIYTQIILTCLCTFGNLILPKKLTQMTILGTAICHLFFSASVGFDLSWKLRKWIRFRSLIRSIGSVAIYLRLLGGNAPFLKSNWSRLGISLISLLTLFIGFTSLPLSTNLVIDIEGQQFENASIWPAFKVDILQISLSAAFVLISAAYFLPLIIPVFESQNERFQRLLNRADLLLFYLTLSNLFLKDLNFSFGKSNAVDFWLQVLWVLHDITLCLGLSVLQSLHHIEPV